MMARGKNCNYNSGRKEAKRRRTASAGLKQAERAHRSPAQQLAVLNNRLGVGVGATKERARLEAKLPKEE